MGDNSASLQTATQKERTADPLPPPPQLAGSPWRPEELAKQQLKVRLLVLHLDKNRVTHLDRVRNVVWPNGGGTQNAVKSVLKKARRFVGNYGLGILLEDGCIELR